MSDSRSSKAARWASSVGRWVLLALAALPAAWPYFGRGFPRTNDALPHLYRALALERLVRAGHLWPRWSPDLVHGYGYPVFNFFPALSHYLVVAYHLIGLPLATAYRAAVLTHFVLAAWFAYVLARELFGPTGGWVAALAYAYSPYLLYDIHVRAGLPESQALALFPLLVLALRRATLRGGRWIAISALAFAAAFLSHFPITFQFLIPIGLMLVWMGWQQGWRRLWRPVLGLSLGVLVTAFFWLPTLAEVQYVQTDVSIGRGYGYEANFLGLREIVAWPRLPADPALVNPPVVRALPLVALGLAALLLAWRWITQRLPDRATRRQVVLWLGLLLVCTSLVTPLSRPVWDGLPLLNLTLYPWRFLGPASLAGAMLLAAAFDGLVERIGRARTLGLLAAVTLSLLAAGVPWLYPPREPVPQRPTIAHLAAFEQPPLFIGTTTLGEFLPRWVEELPDTTALRQSLAAGESSDRLVVPEGVTVLDAQGSPLDASYTIHADNPATLTYRQFYFPGWQATLDGNPLPVHPSHPEGLLLVEVPAGEHRLQVTFGSTPSRILGWMLSGLGALGVAMVLARPAGRTQAEARRLPLSWLVLLTGLVLVAKLFFDSAATPLRRPMLGPEGLRGVQHAGPLDFAGELQLLGYDLHPGSTLPAGEEVALTLYWRTLRPIGVVYDRAVHVVGEQGIVWSREAARPTDWRFAPGTDLWPPDGYVMDPYVLQLVDGTPPGEYTFRVALVRRDTGHTVAAHHIGRLLVTRPTRGERSLEEALTPAPEGYVWDGLRLLGSRIDRSQAAPGDPVRVTLLWQIADPTAVPEDGEFTLHLETPDGEELLSTTRSVAAGYPPQHRQTGDRLRSEVVLRLPARTPDGTLRWGVRAGEGALRSIGSLHVDAPDRRWTAPGLDIPIGIHLGGVTQLLGANVEPAAPSIRPPATLTVTLAWQAEREMGTSYHVFLHLEGPDGQLMAQSDGEPASWARPTTGWLPGEIVLDERVLHVPADAPSGTYTLVAGLYEPGGPRLTTPDGDDVIFLRSIRVESP